MVEKFARMARERIRIEGGGDRRDHPRALAQQTLAATPGRSQFCSEMAEREGFGV